MKMRLEVSSAKWRPFCQGQLRRTQTSESNKIGGRNVKGIVYSLTCLQFTSNAERYSPRTIATSFMLRFTAVDVFFMLGCLA